MNLSKEDTLKLIEQGKKYNLTGKQVIDGLIMRGYQPEGVNIKAIKQGQVTKAPTETMRQDLKGDFMGIGEDILESSQKRAENITDIRNKVASGEKSRIAGSFQTAGQLAGAGADAIGSAFIGGAKMLLSPKSEEKVKGLVTQFGQKVMENPQVQGMVKWYDSLPEETKDNIDAVGGFTSLASEFIGVGLAKRGGQLVSKGVQSGVKAVGEGVDTIGTGIKKVTTEAGRIASDVIPSKQRIINTQVTKALDLSPGDLDKLARSTGNELGVYLADKNLIGVNKADTIANLQKLYDDSYKTVREQIGNVKKTYKVNEVPDYKVILKEVKSKVDDIIGLDDVNKEIDTLLKKKTVTLNDIQRSKELLDEHFKLYKVTGDVAEEISKKGLANKRKAVKEFIENEVEMAGGQNIRQLNNDVMTSRSIIEAVKTRSPKGLTKSNLQLGDLGAFGVGAVYGGVPGGLASVLFKKILESPTIRLRMSKWLDKLEDAKKVKVLEQLKKGEVPQDLQKAIGQDLTPNISAKNTNTKNISISPNSTTKGLKAQGEILETNLIKEAQKYKSAEEFVKAQPKLYHGGSADIKDIQLGKSNFQKTFYMSENPDYAKSFGGNKSSINEIVVDSKAKLADLRKPSDDLVKQIEDIISPKPTGKTVRIQKPDGTFLEIPETKGGISNPVHSSEDILNGIRQGKAYFAEMPEVKKALKKLGYDGQITSEVPYAKNIGVWNKEVIKTKSQLEEIWNKANKK